MDSKEKLKSLLSKQASGEELLIYGGAKTSGKSYFYGVGEKQIDDYLVKKVEALGGICLKLETNLRSGLPDRLILLPGGKVGFAELKSPKKDASPLQKWTLKILNKLGFPAIKINSVLEIDEFINLILE